MYENLYKERKKSSCESGIQIDTNYLQNEKKKTKKKKRLRFLCLCCCWAPCMRLLLLYVDEDAVCCHRQVNQLLHFQFQATNCCAMYVALASVAIDCHLPNWCPVPPMRMPPRCCQWSALWATPSHRPAAAVAVAPSQNLFYISLQICVSIRSV